MTVRLGVPETLRHAVPVTPEPQTTPTLQPGERQGPMSQETPVMPRSHSETRTTHLETKNGLSIRVDLRTRVQSCRKAGLAFPILQT
jgi:hypothetical protein